MSGIIHTTHRKDRKDRYRTVFCDELFYKTHQELFKLWKTRFENLNSVDKVQAWVLALSCLRRPTDWFGGRRQAPLWPGEEASHPLTLGDVFALSPVKVPSKLTAGLPVNVLLNEYRIKALPDSCLRSLVGAAGQRYPLVITDHVPSPQELLDLQIAGRRVVSFNEDFERWPGTLNSGRDFLGFVLHDLIHADHFFHDPRYRDGQRGFYRWVRGFLEDPALAELLGDRDFRESFEYLISDMNAHPVHLIQTLHAALFRTLRQDRRAGAIWSGWITRMEPFAALTSEERLALEQINRPEFAHSAAHRLEILCIRLGQQAGETAPNSWPTV